MSTDTTQPEVSAFWPDTTIASQDDPNVVLADAPFTARFEFITPERAAQLLATSRHFEHKHGLGNRNIARNRVDRYREDMEAEFWEVTHQGIAIDENGCLLDGQHRLQAIVETGIGVVMLVSYDVPTDVFWLIDGGFARSAQSFIQGQYGVQRTALARTLMRLEEKEGVAELSSIGNGQYPSHRILRFLEERSDVREYGEAFSRAAVAASKTRGTGAARTGPFMGTSVVGLLVAGFITGPQNWTRWWEDVHAIANHDGLEDGNPVKALANCSPVGGNMTNVNYMRAIYAGVKYRDGKDLRMIRSGLYETVRVW